MTVKFNRLLLLSFIVVVFHIMASCTVDNIINNEELFKIRRTYEIGYEELAKQGFERVTGIDVLVLEKVSGDTTISMSFGQNGKLLYSKNWRFEIPSSDRKWLEDFFENKGAFLISPIAKFDLLEDLFFNVKDVKGNRLFPCNVTNEGKRVFLDVTYYYPHY